MATRISVKSATQASAELEAALARLLPQLNPTLSIPNRKQLRSLISDEASTLLVARDGKAIVGTATVVLYTTVPNIKARIEDVVVDEAARGKGVGEALVNECISIARRRGASVVELQSAPWREAANQMYPRLGFELRTTNVYRLNLE
jgi:ribosomal protein S18 acetylase RimI-like enzyme